MPEEKPDTSFLNSSEDDDFESRPINPGVGDVDVDDLKLVGDLSGLKGEGQQTTASIRSDEGERT